MVIIAALALTAIAYINMVPFLRDDLGWQPELAWALGGVFELSLIALGLLARWAALAGQSSETFMMWTWLFALMSGCFAAAHMINAGIMPVAALFAALIPLVAALMWHFVLGMEIKAVKGIDWSERRRRKAEERAERRGEKHMKVWARACQRLGYLSQIGDQSAEGRKKILAAYDEKQAAEDKAIEVLGIEGFTKRAKVWGSQSEAAKEHVQRLYGTSSVPEIVVRAEAPAAPAETTQASEDAATAAEPAPAAARHAAKPARRIREARPGRPAQERTPRPGSKPRTSLPDDPGTNAEILNMRESGMKGKEIADAFRVDPSTVSRRLRKLDENPPKTPAAGVPVVTATPAA